MRSAWLEVVYPILHAELLPRDTRPFVLLEIGKARVVPSLDRAMSSWVHDHLVSLDQVSEFLDNRPHGVRCVHPMVTALEKLEAIARKFDRGKAAPDFVRHYEDAAHIILRAGSLPELKGGMPELISRLEAEDGKAMPASSHPAFSPAASERWHELERAWTAIGPMYWGPRLPLSEASAVLRDFLDGLRAC